MNTLWGRRPALILSLVTSAIAMGVGFGLDVTIEQGALITAFAAAVMGVITQQNVSPFHQPEGDELV